MLAVFRVTHLLNAEDGPWDAAVHLRRWAGVGFWGALLDCFHCLSLWVAAAFAVLLGESWKERLLLWPALSAGAIMLEGVSAKRPPTSRYKAGERELGMPCCGKKRADAQRAASSAAPPQTGLTPSTHQPGAGVVFEYFGQTSMSVTCPVSQQRYYFSHPGARVEVEPGDVATVTAVPYLRMLRI
jgi:hypothetical protein